MNDTCAIILAAGRGTRMGGDIPKVLLQIGNRPIIQSCLENLEEIGLKNIYVVVGYKSKLVKKSIEKMGLKVSFIKQKELLGTAHSLRIALGKISDRYENTLLLFGDDSGLYKPQTLKEFLQFHKNYNNNATFMVLRSNLPTKLGGVLEDEHGNLRKVVSMEDMIKGRINNYLILLGAFCFNTKWVKDNVGRISKNPKSGEYLLPSLIQIAYDDGDPIRFYELQNENEWHSVNTPEELSVADNKAKEENYGES